MSEWLLLLHQVPPKPAYRRVKVWRRLQAAGAVALKNAAYALPAGPATREVFRKLADEIAALGGDALVAEARFVRGVNDGEIVSVFQGARDRDYAAVAEALPAPREGVRPTSVRRAEIAAALGRARRRLKDIQAIDFFGAPGREGAEAAIAALEHRLIPAAVKPPRIPAPADFKGRTWVTRRGVHVDRMACAWLIRRFIDKDARFRFVPGLGYRPGKAELRFDMADAEFTHEGDRCSFEVLIRRAGLDDPALAAVGEIVHDLDLKDGKFGRAETPGIGRLIAGIAAAQTDDMARIARASAVFDDLYESYRRTDRRIRGRKP